MSGFDYGLRCFQDTSGLGEVGRCRHVVFSFRDRPSDRLLTLTYFLLANGDRSFGYLRVRLYDARASLRR